MRARRRHLTVRRATRRLALLVAIAVPLIGAACGGKADGSVDVPAPPIHDAAQVASREITIGATHVVEKSGRFGPDLDFVLRLPETWNGRLIVALPGPAGAAPDLSAFADEQVADGVAYAQIAATGSADLVAVYRAFIAFVADQARAHYGAAVRHRYLVGVALGGWIAQLLVDGDDPPADGALLLGPWGPPDALRVYPAVLRSVSALAPALDLLAAGSAARLSAAQVLQLNAAYALGLPAGSADRWAAMAPTWQASLNRSAALLDPGALSGDTLPAAYLLPARPPEIRARVEALTPLGRITVRVVLLQGAADLAALAGWSAAYEVRVAEAGRGAGIARYLFPDAGATLAAPAEEPAYAQARLRRGWQVLYGWVEDDLRPGPILTVDPSIPASE